MTAIPQFQTNLELQLMNIIGFSQIQWKPFVCSHNLVPMGVQSHPFVWNSFDSQSSPQHS